MLDFSHLPNATNADIQVFTSTNNGLATDDVRTWIKPRGKSMLNILMIGRGGAGGTGVVGANSTAAGGGGGGSGAMIMLTMPMWAVPNILYFGFGNFSAGNSWVAISPGINQSTAPAANCMVVQVGGGGAGGNASGATAGTAGTAGTTPTAALMPLGWAWADAAIGGQAGIAGGTTGAGAALTLPVTGLIVTGGTGGAGLGTAGVAGTAGGAFTVPTSLSFPAQPGGAGGSAATTPPGKGSVGYKALSETNYFYGGTGGGSTHGTATGAGLVQAAGGDGAIGCGGGGMGGALTGSTAAVASKGGPGLLIFTAW